MHEMKMRQVLPNIIQTRKRRSQLSQSASPVFLWYELNLD